jgi:hypothetical protein
MVLDFGLGSTQFTKKNAQSPRRVVTQRISKM